MKLEYSILSIAMTFSLFGEAVSIVRQRDRSDQVGRGVGGKECINIIDRVKSHFNYFPYGAYHVDIYFLFQHSCLERFFPSIFVSLTNKGCRR